MIPNHAYPRSLNRKICLASWLFISSISVGQGNGSTALSDAERVVYQSVAVDAFRRFGTTVRTDEIVLKTIQNDLVSAGTGKYYAIIVRKDKSLRMIANLKLSANLTKGNAAKTTMKIDDQKWSRVAVAAIKPLWPNVNWKVTKFTKKKPEILPNGQSDPSSNTMDLVLTGVQNRTHKQIDMTLDMVTGMVVNARCIPRPSR